MQSQLSDWSHPVVSSLTAALALFFSAIPKVLGFAVIIVVGWMIASLIEKAIAALLRAVNFDGLADRSGFADFVRRTGGDTEASRLIAVIAKWFVRLIALLVAFDALGLPAVSEVLRQLLLWLPNVIVALVIVVIGGIAANGLARQVRRAAYDGGLSNPNLLGKVATIAVWAITIVVAANQIGLATTLVNALFMATVGAVALAVGLAFGLGGRETAGEILRDWHRRGKDRAAQIERSADIAIDMPKAGGDSHTGPSRVK
jgi:small-conductance mechanosensitive channel